MLKDNYSRSGLNTISLFSELLGWKDKSALVKNHRSILYPLRQTIQANREVNRLGR